MRAPLAIAFAVALAGARRWPAAEADAGAGARRDGAGDRRRGHAGRRSDAPAATAPPRPRVAQASPTGNPTGRAPAPARDRARREPLPAAVAVTALPAVVTTSQRQAGVLRDPAPRPADRRARAVALRREGEAAQLFGGAEYLSRGDFYNSPGARVGVTYYPLESIGVELQVVALLELAQRRGGAGQGRRWARSRTATPRPG